MEKFGIDPKHLTHFRTLHSLAFQYLGLSTKDVLKGSDYNELERLIGLPFSSHASLRVTTGLSSRAVSRAMLTLNVINLARARMISVEKQFHESNDWRLNLSQLKVINNALARYKDVHDKMDFVDMIRAVHSWKRRT